MTERSQNDADDGWNEVESPTQAALYDVVATASNAYAVGEDGHLLVRRDDSWEVILERGIKVDSNSLWSVAVSSDDEHIWFTGDRGVLGRYDAGNDGDDCDGLNQLVDYSQTYDNTSTQEGVVVTESAGEERILVFNSSGELLQGENDEGDLTWGDPMKPGGGSSLSGYDLVDENIGYTCDTNGQVYETTDGGESYETIGTEEAPALNDISAGSPDDIIAVAANGSVFQYNGNVWTEQHVGNEEHRTIDIDWDECTGLVCGNNGRVYELGRNGWKADGKPTNDQLNSVAIGSDGPDIAVGANGTIVER